MIESWVELSIVSFTTDLLNAWVQVENFEKPEMCHLKPFSYIT